MAMHTPTPWKEVTSVNFGNGYTYVSVQPVVTDADRDNPLAMMSGEYHICRMSHTAARHKIDLHQANARFIAVACNAFHPLLEAARTALSALEAQEDKSHDTHPAAQALREAIALAQGKA